MNPPGPPFNAGRSDPGFSVNTDNRREGGGTTTTATTTTAPPIGLRRRRGPALAARWPGPARLRAPAPATPRPPHRRAAGTCPTPDNKRGRHAAAAEGGRVVEEGEGQEVWGRSRNSSRQAEAAGAGRQGPGLPAHTYVQVRTARLCAKSERSRREQPGAGGERGDEGAGGGKAPQHTPPAAAASPVLSPGRRRQRSAGEASRRTRLSSLRWRASLPREAGGAHPAPRPGRCAGAGWRGGGGGDGGKPLSDGHAGSAHTPAAARDSALWRCWRRAAAAPQGSVGSYCPAARIALPLPQPSPPGGWVGGYVRAVCVWRERPTDTCKREV